MTERGEVWTKFEYRRGRLRASRSTADVGAGSRLVADLVARFYEDVLPRYARGDLVDLGCGKAPLRPVYEALVDSVILADWPSSLHRTGRELDVSLDLNQPLPFAAASFDTVVLSDVLEHLRYPEQLIHEVGVVLRPGGTLVMNVPFLYWLHETPYDYHRFTEYALASYAEAAGLRVERLIPLGGLFAVGPDLLAKTAAGAGMDRAARVICAAAYRGLQTGLGSRLDARTSRAFPIAYGMVAQRPEDW